MIKNKKEMANGARYRRETRLEKVGENAFYHYSSAE